MSVRRRTWTTTRGERKEAWVVAYTDRDGDRHIRTFARKREADDYHATVKVDVRKGIHVAPSKSPTVADEAEKWIAKVEANGMKGNGPAERGTIRQYRQHINLHLVPLVGRQKMADLTADSAKKLRDDLLAKLSRPLAAKVLTSFKSICKSAGYSHIVADVSIGREKRRRRLEIGRDIPTPAEVKRLIDAETDARRRVLLLAAAFTGLRASELRGLRWSDIDFRVAELHVRQRADRYNTIGSPKSDSGVRTLPLADDLVSSLRAWKLKSQHSADGDYVFGTATGRIQYHKNMLLSLNGTMKTAKLVDADDRPKYGLHSLRHFFASWCINSKKRGGRELPAKEVQALMGHSTIGITFDLYAHLFPTTGDRTELNAAMSRLLS